MQELEVMIQQAALGDNAAFATLVQRFQDMAVGYAYSVLGDFHLAEDAAQEAFVQIYQDLAQLREPNAFPSWFRTVLFKHCDRLTRRKHIHDVSLETLYTVLRNKHPDLFMGWYWCDDQGNPAGYVSGGADRYFTLERALQVDLERGHLSEPIRRQFQAGARWSNPPLRPDAVCTVQEPGRWLIRDGERNCFLWLEAEHIQGAVFDQPLFWVDEVAGDPDRCLVALAQLARQWHCTELFFDRLHYKSGVGKRLRQLRSCRIHTGTFSGKARSYVVRIINLPSLLAKLTPELSLRLQHSHLADWHGNLRMTLATADEETEVMLAIDAGQVAVAPVVTTPHHIQGGQALAQLIVGSEDATEIVEMAGLTLGGDAAQLLPILFPMQYPQMDNQSL